MSAVGACAENHPIETFWNILKREGIYRTVPIGKRTNLGIKKETAKFISYYNNERSSNSLNFLSPIQYKKQQEEKNKLLKRKIIKNKKNKKIIKLTKTK
jgi:putative transposase